MGVCVDARVDRGGGVLEKGAGGDADWRVGLDQSCLSRRPSRCRKKREARVEDIRARARGRRWANVDLTEWSWSAQPVCRWVCLPMPMSGQCEQVRTRERPKVRRTGGRGRRERALGLSMNRLSASHLQDDRPGGGGGPGSARRTRTPPLVVSMPAPTYVQQRFAQTRSETPDARCDPGCAQPASV